MICCKNNVDVNYDDKFILVWRTDDSTCKVGWSQDQPDLQKNVYIYLLKKYYMLN